MLMKLFAVYCAIPGLLFVQLAVTPDNLADFAGLVLKAAQSGQWPMVAALALVAVVWAIRKWGTPAIPFLGTPEGGAVLNLATGFSGALLTALMSGTPFTWSLAWASLQVSILAAGGWSLFKSLLWPLLLKVPFIAGLFARGAAAAVVTEAQKKGLAAAVVAKPPTSTDIANGP